MGDEIEKPIHVDTSEQIDDGIEVPTTSTLRPSPPLPVTLGVKDSDGFLTPPPASTLLIRRTRTNSTGSSTYFVSSPPVPSSVNPTLLQPMDIRKPLSVPHRRVHHDKGMRRSEPCFKRINFDRKKVNVLLTPQVSSPHVKINVPSGNGLHHRSSFPPISPLAIDPAHSLSVTLSSDRSISTVVPIDTIAHSCNNNDHQPLSSEFFPPAMPSTSSNLLIPRPEFALGDDKPKARGKPTTFMTELQTCTSPKAATIGRGGKGKIEKRKRGERGPDRFPNIDPATGRRKYIRKKMFSLDKKQTSRGRLTSRTFSECSLPSYDHDLTGKWRPTDDLRLIVNVLQINDLELVHKGVRFSCKFSLENVERRWSGLLYNKAVSKVSQNAIKNLHPRVVADIHEKALFSPDEDRVLKSVRSTYDPKILIPVMEKLLKEHALVFIKWRTSKSLVEHWLHLRDYHLLCDQKISNYFDEESFSEFEDGLTNQEVRENYDMDSNVRREILIENRHSKKKIRMLEEEVSRWQVLADMVTEIDQTPFEEESFAMLRGKQVRYLMRSREITLGRRTSESMNIDADLSLEGSTYKVSRRQATIQLRPMGDFAIWNQGKHGIYVDGMVVMSGKLGTLVDQSVIEISQLRFVFLINHKMVAEQRKKLIRLEVKKEMVRLAKIARYIKAHPAYPIPAPPFGIGPTSQGLGLGIFSNASATIDLVASSSTTTVTKSDISATTATSVRNFSIANKFSGPLTRPPQPMPRVGTTTTFIKSYTPRTLTSIPVPVFRKPAPPPPLISRGFGTVPLQNVPISTNSSTIPLPSLIATNPLPQVTLLANSAQTVSTDADHPQTISTNPTPSTLSANLNHPLPISINPLPSGAASPNLLGIDSPSSMPIRFLRSQPFNLQDEWISCSPMDLSKFIATRPDLPSPQQ